MTRQTQFINQFIRLSKFVKIDKIFTTNQLGSFNNLPVVRRSHVTSALASFRFQLSLTEASNYKYIHCTCARADNCTRCVILNTVIKFIVAIVLFDYRLDCDGNELLNC